MQAALLGAGPEWGGAQGGRGNACLWLRWAEAGPTPAGSPAPRVALKAPTVQRKVASPARPVTIGMHFGWDEGRANLPSQAGLALEIQQPSGVVRPHTSTNPRDMFLFVFYSSHNYT